MASTRPPALASLLVSALTLLPALGARAQTTSVELYSGVPMSPLPLGQPFTIDTDPDGALEMYGVFVEYAAGSFGSKALSEVKSCSELVDRIKVSEARFTTAFAGEKKVADLFDPARPWHEWSKLGKRPLLLLPKWDKKKNNEGDTKAHLRVPGASFFRRGVHYCLVTVSVRNELVNDDSAARVIDGVVTHLAACKKQQDPAACEAKALAKVTTASQALGGPSREALAKNLGPAISLVSSRILVREALAEIPPPNAPQVERPLDLNNPLGKLVTEALVSAQKLKGAAPNLMSASALPLLKVTFAPDAGLSLIFSVGGGEQREIIKPADLTIKPAQAPNPALTLADVFAFELGAFAVDGGRVPFWRIANTAAKTDLLSAPEKYTADWEKWYAASQSLRDALTTPPPGTLGGALTAWAQQLKPAWRGPNGLGLANVFAAIADFHRDLSAWKPQANTVVQAIISYQLTAVDVTLGLKPDTWVFSYVVPTVGYAWTSRAEVALPTLALQLYLFANSADEPMWAGGYGSKDVRRMFSLEVGIAPKTKTFGPDGRYGGTAMKVPVLLGIGLQLIPYTVISGGFLFTRVRRTTLEQETATLSAIPYLNLSVQANIPDIIKTLVSRKNTSGE